MSPEEKMELIRELREQEEKKKKEDGEQKGGQSVDGDQKTEAQNMPVLSLAERIR